MQGRFFFAATAHETPNRNVDAAGRAGHIARPNLLPACLWLPTGGHACFVTDWRDPVRGRDQTPRVEQFSITRSHESA